MSFWDFLPRIKYAVLLNPSYLFVRLSMKNIQPLMFVSTGMYFRSTICRSEFLLPSRSKDSTCSIAYYHQILKQFFVLDDHPVLRINHLNASIGCCAVVLAMRRVLGKVSKVTLNNERRVLSSFSWANRRDGEPGQSDA